MGECKKDKNVKNYYIHNANIEINDLHVYVNELKIKSKGISVSNIGGISATNNKKVEVGNKPNGQNSHALDSQNTNKEIESRMKFFKANSP